MFDFMVNDIKDYAGYLVWQEEIAVLNKQYFQRYHIEFHHHDNGIYCRKCEYFIFNWRNLYTIDNSRLICNFKKCPHNLSAISNEIRIMLPSNY